VILEDKKLGSNNSFLKKPQNLKVYLIYLVRVLLNNLKTLFEVLSKNSKNLENILFIYALEFLLNNWDMYPNFIFVNKKLKILKITWFWLISKFNMSKPT
jgi:hypothetical protein